MGLPTPQLDDRSFQQIKNEALERITRHCPEWTDHNLSDPGITLIELFAWMTESIIYRLNRVPERAYFEFLDLLGISLEPPRPAQVDATFRLTAPQPEPIVIPAGTELATVRTETQEAITFTTTRDLGILVPSLRKDGCRVWRGGEFADYLPVLERNLRVNLFQDKPQPGDMLYLGYQENLTGHTLALRMHCDENQGQGVDPWNPPLIWEYWSGAAKGPEDDQPEWRPCRLRDDTTGGLNRRGVIILDVPLDAADPGRSGSEGTWLRCRVTDQVPEQPFYTNSPQLYRLTTEAIGGTVPAEHSIRIDREELGQSDGTPNQTFALKNTPVLKRKEEIETLEVIDERGQAKPWTEAEDFADSGPEHDHFALDSISGEVHFGPAMRAPDGMEQQYGRTPPKGARLVFTSYRSGGGIGGNVGRETINVLRSSIPYVAWVINYEPATGGRDAESLEQAKLRGRRAIRSRGAAVTAQDFEELAVQASDGVARARCLSPGEFSNDESVGDLPAGVLRLVLLPDAPVSDQPHDHASFTISHQVIDVVRSDLDDRRLLGTTLLIGPPQFVPLRIEASFGVARGEVPEEVTANARQAILRFLHPVVGGDEGSGWPFGGTLSRSDLFAHLRRVPGVDFVEQVNMLLQGSDGAFSVARTRIGLPADGLFLVREIELEVEAS